MQKIIVAMDSFKGSLTSEEAEEAVKIGLQQALPHSTIVSLPVSDGGEGILSVLLRLSGGHREKVEVTGPLGEKIITSFGVSGEDSQTAFIELASAAGLPLVPPNKRNPLLTTTYGVGQLIMKALHSGHRKIILGIGGSATNDAALGLLTALGYCFLDQEGHQLPGTGASLDKVAGVDATQVCPLVKESQFQVICDVDNVFYGPEGAAYVFAPQKGAGKEMVKQLDCGLRHLAGVIRQATGCDVSGLPGAGAAGGVGGALAAFLNARLQPGIEFVLDALHFDSLLEDTSLVITGEGHADRQSVMGKVISGVLRRAKAQDKPVVLLCGGFEDAGALNRAGITSVFSLVSSPVSLQTAMEKSYATEQLSSLAVQIGRLFAAMSL